MIERTPSVNFPVRLCRLMCGKSVTCRKRCHPFRGFAPADRGKAPLLSTVTGSAQHFRTSGGRAASTVRINWRRGKTSFRFLIWLFVAVFCLMNHRTSAQNQNVTEKPELILQNGHGERSDGLA